MIIFGIRGSKISPLKLKQGSCPHCDTREKMWVLGHRNYFHIFWIPIFPLWKKLFAMCEHCKGVFEKNELPQSELKRSFLASQKEVKSLPWYLFFGTIVFVGLLLWIFTTTLLLRY